MARSFSNEPDPRLLDALQPLEFGALGIAGAIAVCILALWFLPWADHTQPHLWSKMSAWSAAGMLVSVLSLALSARPASLRRRRTGLALGVLVLLVSGLFLLEYAADISFGLDGLLPYQPGTPYPGRPILQTSFAFALTGLCVVTLQYGKNVWSRIADLMALALLALNFVMLGVEFFGPLNHLSIYSRVIMAPQTLLGFYGLSMVITMRRAEQGDMLAVLVNFGIGSRIVRLAVPFALLAPFALLTAASWLVLSGVADVVRAESLTAAAFAILGLCLLTSMGWWINRLERDLRDLSLTDELTGVYNRRGFYFLGQQAMREAQRADAGLSLFFFDLDGLKNINDRLGHDVGSEMITAFARLLDAAFRKSDIIGRVGGDEFAVLTVRDHPMWIESVRARLDALTKAHNGGGKPYALRFSTGYAEFIRGETDTLDSLISHADGLMYQDKASRKELA